ncbi:MAG: isoprenyl transferase [Paludibacteraceae bacterium]|nr:isoprenyl transferase [Paludibacteraceae bacterium]MBR6103436.1 isoprenyl transferase [Paludibacteraceae bacterium]
MTTFLEKLDKERIPTSVAIIMDGNGRWAKKQGKNRIFGHQNGVDSVDQVMEGAAAIGIKYLTLYAFSTENWNRPADEVNALMDLFVTAINSYLEKMLANNIRMVVIGDVERLSEKTRSNMQMAIDKTAACTGMTLVLAISYSSRWEIVRAVRNIAAEVKDGRLALDDIDDECFSNHLATKGIPDPDLLIRTSGELRISNFLMWQLSYSELYFTDVCWPEFKKEQLYEAIYDYQNRERRFGKTSEQLTK